MHCGRIATPVDDGAAPRLAPSDRKETRTKPLVEVAALLFEPVIAAARRGAGEAHLDRKVEDQREVGTELAGDEAIKRFKLGARNAARAPLIGDGGIGEAVGDDPDPLFQRRPYGTHEVVAARRSNEERLGDRVPAPRVTADEKVAQLFGARGASRLACRHRADARAPECLDEKPDLSGLAGAFAAFEGDETSPQRFAPNIR
jgi:hypothetical protein